MTVKITIFISGKKGVANMSAAPLVGSLFSAVGTMEHGDAAQFAGEINAGQANLNAYNTLEEGRIAGIKQKREATQSIGEARAQYGASGIDTNQGSALDILQNSATNAAYDALNIKHSYEAKAQGYRNSAFLYQYEGDSAYDESRLSAAGQLLSGAGQTYGRMK